jgi:hypothetical protein
VDDGLPAFGRLDGGKETVSEIRKRNREAHNGWRVATPVGAVTGDACGLIHSRARF